ncbi:MAG: DUF4905 domain-containing protein [Ignavibacteriae bacterium]|nr:DUF4905 domain-containing protein [Ignavibacteriota bacterium]
MKLKKTFSFIDKNQIWRLLISESDKLLIETRDLENKEVFFNYIDLNTGKSILKNFQLEEKFWIGIEKIYKEKMIFHHYAKPNMPEHKKIIVYDIFQNQIIWQNDDLVFLTIFDDKIYAIKKKFEGREIYILDINSGEIIGNVENEDDKLKSVLENVNFEDYSDYKYPETHYNDEQTNDEIISKETKGNWNVTNIDKLQFGDLLMFNYHVKKENNSLDNMFAVYNIEKKKKVISEILNKNLNSYSPDSFFCYKNNLIVLKNKIELFSYKIV